MASSRYCSTGTPSAFCPTSSRQVRRSRSTLSRSAAAGEEFHQRIGAIGHPGQRLEQRRHEAWFDLGLPAVRA